MRNALLPWMIWGTFASALPVSAGTLAYYRFEGEMAGAPIKAVKDSEGKSTAKGSWNATYSTNVPLQMIPQTGAANTGSASFPAEGRKGDLVSDSTSAINTHKFINFTVEAWICFETTEGGYQTVIGRNNNAPPDDSLGRVALFYLSLTPNNAKGKEIPGSFRLELINSDGASIFTNSQTTAEPGTWYHVAVVGDATRGSVSLFVNGVEEGSATGYSGLYAPNGGSSWTIGRGQFNRRPADFVTGVIDEVRFSDAALSPSEFLYAAKKP